MAIDQAPPAGPGDPRPVFHSETVSSLCSLLARPVVMTGLFREMLTRHFQDGRMETLPELASLIWRPGDVTGIVIESIHRWRPQTTGQRPAVVIKRNAYRNQRYGIGDRQQGNPTDRTGTEKFTTFWVGSHTLFCLGDTGARTELLATEVQRQLTEFGPQLRESIKLHRFAVLEVGPVAELEEQIETFVVPVIVGYAFEETWVVTQQAPKLSRVSLSTLLDC